MNRDVVITHGIRSPIGKMGGSLKNVDALNLATLVVEHLVFEQAKIDPFEINQMILGEVKQSTNPSNIARVVALNSTGLDNVAGYTVHRQCGSGLQAIIDAYEMITVGDAEVIIAGGVENMSQSSYFMREVKDGLGNGNFVIEDSLTEGGPGSIPKRKYGNYPMGLTAENLAEKYHITRERQDEFAQLSQEKMDRAIKENRFKDQILPIKISNENIFDTDEHPNLSNIETLSKLKSVFKDDGSVTAGNSSGRNDAAAAMLVMSRIKAEELGYQPLAKIVSMAASGCAPTMMGIGPVSCTEKALQKANLRIQDLDVIELNEAFAAQSLAVVEEWKKWGISEADLIQKINPNGGAIAHGHPLGCTGAALTIKCMNELHRLDQNKYGLITLCCAGGLGVALIIEKC